MLDQNPIQVRSNLDTTKLRREQCEEGGVFSVPRFRTLKAWVPTYLYPYRLQVLVCQGSAFLRAK